MVFVQMRPQPPTKHSFVCASASTHPCQSTCICVAQEIQMQIKDILHKNKINHNFHQKEFNKFTFTSGMASKVGTILLHLTTRKQALGPPQKHRA